MSLNACKATSEEEASLLTWHDGHPLQSSVMEVGRERSMTFSDKESSLAPLRGPVGALPRNPMVQCGSYMLVV